MMPCCSTSLFRLKFSAFTFSMARRPPFFSTTASSLISAIGKKRWVEADWGFFLPRTVSKTCGSFFLAGVFSAGGFMASAGGLAASCISIGGFGDQMIISANTCGHCIDRTRRIESASDRNRTWIDCRLVLFAGRFTVGSGCRIHRAGSRFESGFYRIGVPRHGFMPRHPAHLFLMLLQLMCYLVQAGGIQLRFGCRHLEFLVRLPGDQVDRKSGRRAPVSEIWLAHALYRQKDDIEKGQVVYFHEGKCRGDHRRNPAQNHRRQIGDAGFCYAGIEDIADAASYAGYDQLFERDRADDPVFDVNVLRNFDGFDWHLDLGFRI